jgi:demethylmenaquinone methyltransferase/2-methoxy-6-polyprenyl-1,4-benzoquinol methylase
MRLDEVARNYDWIAPWYDQLTDLVFGRVLHLEHYRARAIDALGDLEGATVLDVGCGTGRNFSLLLHRIGNRGRLIGLDYSEGMLARAQERIRSKGWKNVELVRGDAASLDGVPDKVDAIVSVWCYGIVHDLDGALKSAVDRLRPEGRIAIVDFQRSRPERGLARCLYPLYSWVLRQAGIDTLDDLDDARLRARWEQGKTVLQARLCELREERYLKGMGFVLSGRKPPDGTAGD